jgi:hypothetical protein
MLHLLMSLQAFASLYRSGITAIVELKVNEYVDAIGVK